MTKAQRRAYNRKYYRDNKKRISAYKAKRYAEDPEYRRNLKLSAAKRKENDASL